MNKVLLMNSGGPDCASIAAKLHKEGLYVISLYVDMNTTNRIPASEAARITADKWCDEHHTALIDFGRSPSYDKNGMTMASPGIAPMMVVFGTVWGGIRQLDEVYFGITNGVIDPVIKRREDWLEHIDAVLSFAVAGHQIKQQFPLWDIPKSEEAAWAGITNEDLRYTVTCSAAIRDNTCIKCIDRQEAGIPV